MLGCVEKATYRMMAGTSSTTRSLPKDGAELVLALSTARRLVANQCAIGPAKLLDNASAVRAAHLHDAHRPPWLRKALGKVEGHKLTLVDTPATRSSGSSVMGRVCMSQLFRRQHRVCEKEVGAWAFVNVA